MVARQQWRSIREYQHLLWVCYGRFREDLVQQFAALFNKLANALQSNDLAEAESLISKLEKVELLPFTRVHWIDSLKVLTPQQKAITRA